MPSPSSRSINIGTTTEEVARTLCEHEQPLILTSNLNVATEPYRYTGIGWCWPGK